MTATGLIDTPELPRPPQGGAEPPQEARSGIRRAFFEAAEGRSGGWAECPVWRREALLAGNEFAGPAIVEEISATTVLYPGDRAHVDADRQPDCRSRRINRERKAMSEAEPIQFWFSIGSTYTILGHAAGSR